MTYREILDVDDCLVNPCAEGATCVDESFNFTCICPLYAIGRLCEGEKMILWPPPPIHTLIWFDFAKCIYPNLLGDSPHSLFSVSNCGGQLLAIPVTQYVTLPSLFPDYGIHCGWNISAPNELSLINITVDDNLQPYERGQNCFRLIVSISPGKQSLFLSWGKVNLNS